MTILSTGIDLSDPMAVDDYMATIQARVERAERLLLSRFSEAIGAESLPKRVAHEEKLYSSAIRRVAGLLGKGEPSGIVILSPGPAHASFQ